MVPVYRDRLGARLGQVSRPLCRVGLYVPGGTARYPSSVLMTAIPARVAGVAEVLVVSPADRRTGDVDAWTLAACHVSGVSRLFRVGGAQAVAALAHGTATDPGGRQDLRPRATPTWPPPSGSSSARWTST